VLGREHAGRSVLSRCRRSRGKLPLPGWISPKPRVAPHPRDPWGGPRISCWSEGPHGDRCRRRPRLLKNPCEFTPFQRLSVIAGRARPSDVTIRRNPTSVTPAKAGVQPQRKVPEMGRTRTGFSAARRRFAAGEAVPNTGRLLRPTAGRTEGARNEDLARPSLLEATQLDLGQDEAEGRPPVRSGRPLEPRPRTGLVALNQKPVPGAV